MTMASSSAIVQMPSSLEQPAKRYTLRSSIPDHVKSEGDIDTESPDEKMGENLDIPDSDSLNEGKSNFDHDEDDMSDEADDDLDGKNADESDDDDDDDDACIDALLEVEEERIMKLEEKTITEDSVLGQPHDQDNISTASTNQELSDFMRERRRTMSIDVEKGSISFEIDGMGMHNMGGDSFLGYNIGSDDSSILASDLPPLIMTKLVSRSRSNSVATQQGSGRERGGSLDGILPTLMTSSSCTANVNGKAGTTTTVTFAQMGESAPGGRDRTFSFEFFSFGGVSDHVNVSPAVDTGVGSDGKTQKISHKVVDSTPLVQNGRKRLRTRSGSLTAPVSPTNRGRVGSLCLTLSPTISINSTSCYRKDSVASSLRPRGDSIIFDPTSFSDGGIHEQRALQIASSPFNSDAQKKEASNDFKSKKVVCPKEESNDERDSALLSKNRDEATPAARTHPQGISSESSQKDPSIDKSSTPASAGGTTSKKHLNTKLDASVEESSRDISSADGEKRSKSSVVVPVPGVQVPGVIINSCGVTNLGGTPDVAGSAAKLPAISRTSSASASTVDATASNPLCLSTPYAAVSMTPGVAPFANRQADKIGVHATSDVGCEAITVPSCITSGTTFTMEILNKDGRIGIYLPEERKLRLELFHAKRKMRIWRKRIKYDCRKKLADSRPRIKGRFVRRSDMDED